MDQDTVLPDAPIVDAGADGQQSNADQTADTAKPEGEADKPEGQQKPEKTPEQRELDRMRRGIDRKTRQAAEARAELEQARQELDRLRRPEIGDTNAKSGDDSESLSLSRSQLAELVKAEAAKLAPTITQQKAEIEHRQGIVASLSKQWGAEKFDALAADLDEAIGGLADRTGRAKPVADAIFDSDSPAALIEYLADPENADEAERLANLRPVQLGRAIAGIETKIKAAADKAKPVPSKAGAPLEPLRSQGVSPIDESRMTDEQFARHRAQLRKRA